MNCRFLMSILQLTSLLAVGGCATWRAKSVAVGPDLLDSHPKVLRVTLRDHRPFVLHEPRIEGDSLIGFAPTREPDVAAPSAFFQASKSNERVTVALADIAAVEMRETDATPALFVLVPILGVVVIGLLAVLSGWPQ